MIDTIKRRDLFMLLGSVAGSLCIPKPAEADKQQSPFHGGLLPEPSALVKISRSYLVEGEDRSPEAKAFLAEIAEVCLKHRMLINEEDGYYVMEIDHPECLHSILSAGEHRGAGEIVREAIAFDQANPDFIYPDHKDPWTFEKAKAQYLA